MRILLFAADDDLPKARALAARLKRAGRDARVVNRLARTMEGLKLVVTYGVVEPAVAVVVRDDAVVARFVGVPTHKTLLAACKRLDALANSEGCQSSPEDSVPDSSTG